jgi:hypothetical protein
MNLMRTLTAFFIFSLILVSLHSNGQPRANGITGTVVDCKTSKPIAGAWVTVGAHPGRTDANGRFRLSEHADYVDARAIGYSRTHARVYPDMQITLEPLRVHGLYLSFWGVGSSVLRTNVLNTAKSAHLNALVIDVKGDRGFISIKTNSALAAEVHANQIITIPDATALITDLHKRGLYCIARIVTFKDNPLARSRPDLAVKTSQNSLFVDREGLAWTDPFNHTVWDYDIGIAIEAAKAGFDEIQFDYVRFPDQRGLQFSKPNNEENRRQAITDFLATSRERLTPFNVFMAADNFGYVCWNIDDIGIGQCVADIGQVTDYICPMLYPSGFKFGIPGLRNPLDDPYRIVFASLKRAKERTDFSPLVFRPWLQAFKDYAFDHRKFGKAELRQQIKAAEDAGADGWLLWDPRNRYDSSILSELSKEIWYTPTD